MSKLPKFEGKPLIEIPEVIPVANFLTGDFGREALKEYQERAKVDFNENRKLNVLSYQDGVVKGSNPFAVVLMNKVLGQEGIRTATSADSEEILRKGVLPLRGQYIDTALVLRSKNDSYTPNDSLARDLSKQVEGVEYPVMIPLASLELVNADNQYGLAYRLIEGAEVVKAPELAHKNNRKRFSRTDENGLPIFDKKGSRTLYSRDSGLSRLGLKRDLYLGSGWDYLDYSDDGGRVVAVRGEATAPDLEKEITSYASAKKLIKSEKEKH